MRTRSLLQSVISAEWQFRAPASPSQMLLTALGFYRFRTWVASRGAPVPDAKLYQPQFSPWLGLPEFEAHYQAVRHHTLVSRDRCHVLWKTLQQALRLSGSVVECGVFRGGTALLAARTMADGGQADRNLHLFDSFEGMPTDTAAEEAFRSGDLGRTSPQHVRRLLSAHAALHVHVGYIPATFADLELGPVAWAHVDLDLHDSIRDAIAYLYPRIVPGGYMIFDDYGFPSCPGARKAIDEAFANRPEVVLCLPTGQAMVVKMPAGVGATK